MLPQNILHVEGMMMFLITPKYCGQCEHVSYRMLIL